MARDPADRAQAEQEMEERIVMSRHQENARRLDRALSALTGYCLFCEAPLKVGRYCDSDCQQDHEKLIRARGMRPRLTA